MLRLLRWVTGPALLALSLSGPAWADDDIATRSAARTVALDGVAALQRGDAGLASRKLEKAYRVLRVPSIGLWSARALVKSEKLVEASERYMEASRLSIQGEKEVQEQAQRDAIKELDELTPRIPSLLISIEGAGESEVSVTLVVRPNWRYSGKPAVGADGTMIEIDDLLVTPGTEPSVCERFETGQ